MLLQMLARHTVGGKNQKEVFIVKKRAFFIVLLAFSLLLAACNGNDICTAFDSYSFVTKFERFFGE